MYSNFAFMICVISFNQRKSEMGNAALSAKFSFFSTVNLHAASYMPVFDWPNYLIHRILFLIAIIKRTILEHFFLKQLYMIKYSA